MHSSPKPKKSAIGYSSLARQSPRPSRPRLKSIPHEPAKKIPPPAQEAPKKEHGPVARDLAAEGQRRDTQEPPAAVGSIVRPPAETRPGIRTGAPEHEPKRRQRPSPRGSTAEGGQQNPNRDHIQVSSRRRKFVQQLKDNPGREKKLRKTRLFSKAFRRRSNLPCSMGTRFALRALRLGGWSMASGARSLRMRSS